MYLLREEETMENNTSSNTPEKLTAEEVIEGKQDAENVFMAIFLVMTVLLLIPLTSPVPEWVALFSAAVFALVLFRARKSVDKYKRELDDQL